MKVNTKVNTKENTKLLAIFLTVCISTRLLISYILWKINPKYLPIAGIILIGIGLGFLYQTFNSKKTGAFGQKVWWNNLRPVHALLYIIGGIMALNKDDNAYKIILLDTTIGLLSVINKRLII